MDNNKNQKLTDEEKEYIKAMEENPPKIVKELMKQPGEIIFSNLNSKDKTQLFVRYANDICTYLKNIVLFEVKNNKYLKWLCEKNGIDVSAKEKEEASKMKAELDKAIEKSKEKLEGK